MHYVIVLCEVKQQILVVLKKKPKHLAGRLNLLGGKIEEGESVAMAAIRELHEESGFLSNSIALLGRIVDGDMVIHCCVAKDVKDVFSPKPRAEETEEIFWMHWNVLKNDPRIIPNLKVIIPMLLCGIGDFTIEDNEPPGCTNHSFRVILDNL